MVELMTEHRTPTMIVWDTSLLNVVAIVFLKSIALLCYVSITSSRISKQEANWIVNERSQIQRWERDQTN
jgi:hypothetical protein